MSAYITAVVNKVWQNWDEMKN